ncbi:MAG: glycine zipper family protein [Pseudomonadota bacterium]
MFSDRPPTYSESELQARAEAAEAMRATYKIEPSAPPQEVEAGNDAPPPYDQVYVEQHQLFSQYLNAPSAPPPSPEVLQGWYESDLETSERITLQTQYQNILLDEHKYNEIYHRMRSEELKKRFATQRQFCLDHPLYPMTTLDDFLLMQYMVRDLDVLIRLQWRLNLYILETVVRTASYVLPGLMNIASSSLQAGSAIGQSLNHGASHGSGGNGHKALLAIAAIAILFSAAAAAVASTYYAVTKTASSLNSISKGEKLVASFLRITAMVSSAVAGTFGGIMAGAALGSLIPGFGTLAGAIVGGIIGATLLSGVGVFITKHALRLTSWLWNHNDNTSPTNPNKYRLNNQQQQRFAMLGPVDTQRIHLMLHKIKINKPEKPLFISNPANQELNCDYNELLQAVKTHRFVATEGFYFAKKNLFTWNNTYRNWTVLPLDNNRVPRPPAYQRR